MIPISVIKTGSVLPVAGADLWLDGADPDAFVLDNVVRVAVWIDKTDNHHFALQSTASSLRPTYGSRQIAGYTVPEFSSAQRIDTQSHPNDDRTSTGFIVALLDAITGSPTLWASAAGTDGNHFLVGDGAGNLVTNQEFVAEIARNTLAAVSVGSQFLAVQRLTATAVEQILDGVSETDADSSTFTASRFTRLGQMHNGGQTLNGLIAEVVRFPFTLTDQELADMTLYLKTKWRTP